MQKYCRIAICLKMHLLYIRLWCRRLTKRKELRAQCTFSSASGDVICETYWRTVINVGVVYYYLPLPPGTGAA